MSEPTATDVFGSAAGDRQETLTPQTIDAVLADFRAWLVQVADEPPALPPNDSEPIDLHTLLGQFVALRHDVNLQTRATRAQQELNSEMLQQLRQTLDTLEQSRAAARAAGEATQEEAVRPFLKTLVDVHDALSLAAREVGRAQENTMTALDQFISAFSQNSQAGQGRPPTIWSRLFRPTRVETSALERNREVVDAAARARQMLRSILTGYTMSLQRLERALQQTGLEPIPCIGQTFDPELMEVVAAVDDSSRRPGEVVEVVRQGYLWHGRMFRYAQVSVARQ